MEKPSARKAHSSAETLRRILDAATLEFAEKGFDGARLENVARASKVSKQLVYHYFRTKDELYGVVLNSVANEMEPLLDGAVYDALAPADAVRLLADRIIQFYIERPFIAGFTLDQSFHHGHHVPDRSRYIPFTRGLIDKIIAGILQRGVASGEFRDGVQPALLYWMMFSVVSSCFLHGTFMTQTTDIDFESPDGIALWRSSAVDFVLAALRK